MLNNKLLAWLLLLCIYLRWRLEIQSSSLNILWSISFQNYQVLWLISHKYFKFILLAYTVISLSQAFEPSCQATAHSWVVKATNRERLSLKLISVFSGPFPLLGIKHTLCKSKNRCLPRSIGIRFILLCIAWTRSQFLQKKEASSWSYANFSRYIWNLWRKRMILVRSSKKRKSIIKASLLWHQGK